jgi:carbon-monoxide dehydrogenase large subunit
VKPGTEFLPRDQPLLATDRTRLVGDAIAFILAETLPAARDAAELIDVDYAPLSAATACDAAARAGAPLVWDDVPNNIAFEFETGDRAATDAAFARSARVVTLDLVNNRVVQNAMETRNAVGIFEDGRLTLQTGTQMPNRMKRQLADVLKLPPEQIRVLVQDVGGGFGGKNVLYPEQALVLYAARKLGRPVKWVSERAEAFVSDFHGRDNVSHAELALDADGRFLAIRVRSYGNVGAYLSTGGSISPTSVVMLPGTYRTPTVHVEVKGVYTNTVPTEAYRGAGRPEITYLLERLIDKAAAELGIDRVELRRRNLIQPDAFPYATPTGLTYDFCDFAAVMDEALRQADWAGLPARRAEAEKRGKLRGIGMSNYVERCGGGGGLSESARLRFEPDGTVLLLIGSQSNGQGHETAYSQIVSERLGLPFEKIRVIQGDTDRVETGLGTGGSWSIPMGGGAVKLAADKVIEKARRLAAHRLEAAEADLEFEGGAFRVAGTDLSVPLVEIIRGAFDPARLPPGEQPGLEGEERYKPENYTFPFGCHICEVEIDRDSGAVEIVRYTAVHDFGVPLNPLLLAGQVHGGVTQGIGQAMLENTVYDERGQLLTGTYNDYCLPRADDLPPFELVLKETPAPNNPLGIKGCGEAGATGSPPAVINAIVDALSPLGVRHLDMPATPQRVWQAINGLG